jgi:hypothetical protein
MEKIEIELGMWESAPCPIYTANVDLEKAEKLLYQSALTYCSKDQLEDYLTNDSYRGDGWTSDWEKFQEWLCAEEEAIIMDCGGIYYEDMIWSIVVIDVHEHNMGTFRTTKVEKSFIDYDEAKTYLRNRAIRKLEELGYTEEEIRIPDDITSYDMSKEIPDLEDDWFAIWICANKLENN